MSKSEKTQGKSVEKSEEETDPFYSKANIEYLENIVRQVKDGTAHFEEHEIIEVTDDELTQEELEDAHDLKLAQERLEAFEKSGEKSIPWEETKREIGFSDKSLEGWEDIEFE